MATFYHIFITQNILDGVGKSITRSTTNPISIIWLLPVGIHSTHIFHGHQFAATGVGPNPRDSCTIPAYKPHVLEGSKLKALQVIEFLSESDGIEATCVAQQPVLAS
jgi:hypothetical protein